MKSVILHCSFPSPILLHLSFSLFCGGDSFSSTQFCLPPCCMVATADNPSLCLTFRGPAVVSPARIVKAFHFLFQCHSNHFLPSSNNAALFFLVFMSLSAPCASLYDENGNQSLFPQHSKSLQSFLSLPSQTHFICNF